MNIILPSVLCNLCYLLDVIKEMRHNKSDNCHFTQGIRILYVQEASNLLENSCLGLVIRFLRRREIKEKKYNESYLYVEHIFMQVKSRHIKNRRERRGDNLRSFCHSSSPQSVWGHLKKTRCLKRYKSSSN